MIKKPYFIFKVGDLETVMKVPSSYYSWKYLESGKNDPPGYSKSLRNSKRRNKGNFTSKSISNKIKLCVFGGQQYLVLNKISTL